MDSLSSQIFMPNPVRYGSFKATMAEVARAILEGPGRIILVGPCGSGKTTMLHELVHEIGKPIASILNLGYPISHNTRLGIYDNVDEAGLHLLEPGGQFPEILLIAVRREVLDAVVRLFPRSKIVNMMTMSIEDVAQMIEERSRQLKLPAGIFTPWAITELAALSDGCPGRLDQMIHLYTEITKKASSIIILPTRFSRTHTWKDRENDLPDVACEVAQPVKVTRSISMTGSESRYPIDSFDLLKRPLSADERKKAARRRLMRRVQRAVLSLVSSKFFIIAAIVVAAYFVFSIELRAVRWENFGKVSIRLY